MRGPKACSKRCTLKLLHFYDGHLSYVNFWGGGAVVRNEIESGGFIRLKKQSTLLIRLARQLEEARSWKFVSEILNLGR